MKKETVKKTVKAKVEKNQPLKLFETEVEMVLGKLDKNPMLKLGALMNGLQDGKESKILQYIAELEKKFTVDELEKIAAKVMK